MLKYLYYRFYKQQRSQDEDVSSRAFAMFMLFLLFNIYTIVGIPFLILQKPFLKSYIIWMVLILFITHIAGRRMLIKDDKFNLIIKHYDALPHRKNQLGKLCFILYLIFSVVIFFIVIYNVRQIALEMKTF